MAGATHYELPLPTFDEAPKIMVVVAPYYRDIADDLVLGATSVIESVGGVVEVVEVPGALEVPTAIRVGFAQGDYDGYVALGCVIRGETTHYDTVCNDSSHALMLLGLQGAFIGNGILTVENHEQAAVRSDPAGQNKGGGAAAAALHLIALSRGMTRKDKGIGFLNRGDG